MVCNFLPPFKINGKLGFGRLLSTWLRVLVIFTVGAVDATDSVAQLSSVISPMSNLADFQFTKGSASIVAEGENGEPVFKIEGQSSDFAGYIDLAAVGIDLKEFDLIKVKVRTDRAATLVFSSDNYPSSGAQARWYVLDGLRGASGWTTIYIDLDLPEEIKTTVSSPRPLLHISGRIKDTGRSIQGNDRRIWLGEITAAKKVVDIDWNQAITSFTWPANGDLAFTYPITVTNKLDSPITAALSLIPFQSQSATAEFSQPQLELAAGEQRVVQATITLPASEASTAEPLYTERFEARAEALEYANSTVTILRSSDPIHLTVTVPIPNEKLQFPFFPPPNELPSNIVFFKEATARNLASRDSASALIKYALSNGIYNYREKQDNASFRKALIASAYLYNLTGEEQYFVIAKDLLGALPDIWKQQYADYQNVPNKLISSGIIVRMGTGWHYTLGLGWRLMGTQRSPYQYSFDANAGGGGMSSILYAFDMLAQDLDESTRNRFINDFLVPAGIQSRNHYIGDGNQQATANAVALYAGLVSRNWPLVAFAHSSEHSYGSIIDWTFTDSGKHIRKNYQTYTVRPLFWIAELLYGRGINVYDAYQARLRLAVGHGFQDRYFWEFIKQNRLVDPGE
jgi:hypothetical protein